MTAAMTDKNRTPEQQARDTIDLMLERAGWKVQSKNTIDFSAGVGIAVREYPTAVGPADYAIFIDKTPVGVVEAKPEDWGQKITTVEEQSAGYAAAQFKWLNKNAPLPFVYESTGVVTRFTDTRDPNPAPGRCSASRGQRRCRTGIPSRPRFGSGSRGFHILTPPD